MRRAFIVARDLRVSIVVAVCVHLVTAVSSLGHFHDDEHWQILELVGWKLGRTPLAVMPWEHGAQMRPWLQPAAYTALIRLFEAVGVRDPFQQTTALRLATSVAAMLALGALVRASGRWLESEADRRVAVLTACFAPYLPYLDARLSSETASAIALALVVATLAPQNAVGPRSERADLSPARAACAGALLGLAFELRFQTAFAALGVGLWLVAIARAKIGRVLILSAAFALVVVASALVDRWGYGAWAFPPWRYLYENMVRGVAAKRFGTSPAWAYLYLPLANVHALSAATALLLMAATWWRHPRHLVTWTTLPFVVLHSLVAHKEERFLFPLALLSVTFLPLALSPRSSARGQWLARFYRFGRRERALLAIAAAPTVLLAFYPLGWKGHERMHRFVERELGGELRVVVTAEPSFEQYPFYQARPWEIVRPPTGACLTEALAKGPLPLFLYAPSPFDPLPPGVEAHLVFTEVPGISLALVRERLGPPLVAALARAHAWDATLPPARWDTLYRVDSAACPAGATSSSANHDAPGSRTRVTSEPSAARTR